jgi:hypothetical protein
MRIQAEEAFHIVPHEIAKHGETILMLATETQVLSVDSHGGVLHVYTAERVIQRNTPTKPFHFFAILKGEAFLPNPNARLINVIDVFNTHLFVEGPDTT